MIADILKFWAPIAEKRVKQLLESTRATGKTIDSVRVEVSKEQTMDRMQILARPFTAALETGVRPTTKGVSREMIENLKEYTKARGIPEDKVWAIAKTIQKKGDRTFQKGGRDVYSDGVEKMVDEITRDIKKEFKIKASLFLKNSFE